VVFLVDGKYVRMPADENLLRRLGTFMLRVSELLDGIEVPEKELDLEGARRKMRGYIEQSASIPSSTQEHTARGRELTNKSSSTTIRRFDGCGPAALPSPASCRMARLPRHALPGVSQSSPGGRSAAAGGSPSLPARATGRRRNRPCDRHEGEARAGAGRLSNGA